MAHAMQPVIQFASMEALDTWRILCRDLRKALFGRYKRKERVEDDRRDDRGRGGPRPGGRDDFRDRRRDRSPGGGDRRGR